MTIQLPEDLERFVHYQVQSGRFASEQDAITEAVRLLRKSDEKVDAPIATSNAITPEPAWQRVLKIMDSVPDSVFDRIPADSSAQLDHYIYGSPRQP